MTHDPGAEEALAVIRSAREGMAMPAHYPIGYDILYGAICALLVAGQGLPTPWSLLVLAFSLSGLALLVSSWRKRFKWWVGGYSPRRARWVAVVMAVLFLGLIGLSLYGRFQGPDWLFLVSGAIGFVSAIVGSRVWMRVWRKELLEDVR